MDPKFHDQVIRELRQLLEDEQTGVSPRNQELRAAVYAVLRKQETDQNEAVRRFVSRNRDLGGVRSFLAAVLDEANR